MHARFLHIALAATWLAAASPVAQAGTTDFKIQTKDVGPMTFSITNKDTARIQEKDSQGKLVAKSIYGLNDTCNLDSTGTREFQVNGYMSSFKLELMVTSPYGITGKIVLTRGTLGDMKVEFPKMTGATATYDTTSGRVIKIFGDTKK